MIIMMMEIHPSSMPLFYTLPLGAVASWLLHYWGNVIRPSEEHATDWRHIWRESEQKKYPPLFFPLYSSLEIYRGAPGKNTAGSPGTGKGKADRLGSVGSSDCKIWFILHFKPSFDNVCVFDTLQLTHFMFLTRWCLKACTYTIGEVGRPHDVLY